MKCTAAMSLRFSLALFGLWLPVSCGNPPEPEVSVEGQELARAEKVRLTLESELKLLREDFQNKYHNALKQAEDLQKANDELKQQLEKAQDEADKSRKELQEHLAKYKISMRQKAKGLQIPMLQAADGKVFEGVTISDVTPDTLSFQHSGGVSRLPLEKLATEWQKKFFYDPEEIKAIEAAKLAQAAASEAVPEADIPKDVASRVDPIILKRLKDRIFARKAEISRINKEAKSVQEGPYGMTNLSKLRLQVLRQRTLRLQDDIKGLQNMLHQAARGQISG
ncbi:MAG: hypothetical protein ACR2OZ_01190 [Verrucomicrobiales bacterium]